MWICRCYCDIVFYLFKYKYENICLTILAPFKITVYVITFVNDFLILHLLYQLLAQFQTKSKKKNCMKKLLLLENDSKFTTCSYKTSEC